ncbi:MAG: hypothetical protein WB715_20060 [Roseiarcus sp.]|uniref:hypothetical protein n=1 Tax=Roseiarcus sp. TaxID=1969460 RepID=UPI003C6A28EC
MRAQIAILVAASLVTGCCAGGYPAVSGANPAPFDAFQAGMKLAVGMPTDVAILIIGSEPLSAQAMSCGILAGYEWTCQLMKFGCCENNQLLVYIAPTPDGRGAVNSWAVRKS